MRNAGLLSSRRKQIGQPTGAKRRKRRVQTSKVQQQRRIREEGGGVAPCTTPECIAQLLFSFASPNRVDDHSDHEGDLCFLCLSSRDPTSRVARGEAEVNSHSAKSPAFPQARNIGSQLVNKAIMCRVQTELGVPGGDVEDSSGANFLFMLSMAHTKKNCTDKRARVKEGAQLLEERRRLNGGLGSLREEEKRPRHNTASPESAAEASASRAASGQP